MCPSFPPPAATDRDPLGPKQLGSVYRVRLGRILCAGLVASLTLSFGTLKQSEASREVVEARREVVQLYYEFLLDRPEVHVDARTADELLRTADRSEDVEVLVMLKRAMRELFRPQRPAF
jgi:hypothetical protein